MCRIVFPLTKIALREVAEHELELTLPDCAPTNMTTSGYSVVDGVRTSTTRGADTIAILDGELGMVAGAPSISVSPDTSHRTSLHVTICLVGANHWAAEISCRAPYTIEVRTAKDVWRHRITG